MSNDQMTTNHPEDPLTIDDERRDDLDCEANDDCWYCGGDGWGIVGETFPVHDPGWDHEGEIQQCPNCGGSGDANDCTFW